jgi:hypothetical protein
VHAIVHFVRGQRPFDLFDNLFTRWNFGKRERRRRTMQSVEMLMQLEDASVVKPQSFPDCVTALHSGIKRADPGFIAMDELTVDIDDQVAILPIKLLGHEKKEGGLIRKRNK